MHDGQEPIAEVTSASNPEKVDTVSTDIKTSGKSIHSGDDEKQEFQEQVAAPRLQRRLKARHLQMIAIGMFMLSCFHTRSFPGSEKCPLLLPRIPLSPKK